MIIRRILLGMMCLLMARAAGAAIASDQAAALLVYPVIYVVPNDGIDTLVQLSNTSDQPIDVHCFYVNANGHCSDSGDPCYSGADCTAGLCIPGWNETDFHVHLTARQPVAWTASEGLSVCSSIMSSDDCFPLDGIARRGVNGESNAGSRVPPVAETPFVGELKCVAVDDQRHPVESNVLVGSATIVQLQPGTGFLDVTRENAIGLAAIPNTNNGDSTLRLGEEYEPCPNTLILNHFFDEATSPAFPETNHGVLALVPCSEDFNQQIPKSVVAQFLVFNEFEQRFSTSTRVDCYGLRSLSNIDTGQPLRSIFNVGVAGSLVGQTRITGVGAGGHGLLGVFFNAATDGSAGVNLHFQGVSSAPDVIQLP